MFGVVQHYDWFRFLIISAVIYLRHHSRHRVGLWLRLVWDWLLELLVLLIVHMLLLMEMMGLVGRRCRHCGRCDRFSRKGAAAVTVVIGNGSRLNDSRAADSI